MISLIPAAMQTDVAQNFGTPPMAGSSSGPTAGAAFAQHLADTLRAGESAAINGINGTTSVHETVNKVMEAERALNAAVAVRDKIVGAYLELSRMQI